MAASDAASFAAHGARAARGRLRGATTRAAAAVDRRFDPRSGSRARDVSAGGLGAATGSGAVRTSTQNEGGLAGDVLVESRALLPLHHGKLRRGSSRLMQQVQRVR